MAMELAIESLGPMLRQSGAYRTRRAAESMRNEARATPPPGAGDPAVGVGGPAQFVPVVRTRKRNLRYGLVDAAVTFAAMALFTAALAGLVAEVHATASAHVAEAAVTTVAPAVPHVAAPSGTAANAGSNSI